MNFNTIPEALQDLKQGKIILVTDDPTVKTRGLHLCCRICHHRKHQLYGDPRQRSDLYADVRGFRPEAAISADGAA